MVPNVRPRVAGGGARVRAAALRPGARAGAGLARVGARRQRRRHQHLRAQGRVPPAPGQRVRLPQASDPGAAVRDPRVGLRLHRDTDPRVPEAQQQAKENSTQVQSADREQLEEQLGIALRVLRRGEPLGAAVAGADAGRRRGGGAHAGARRPRQRARRAALGRRREATQSDEGQEIQIRRAGRIGAETRTEKEAFRFGGGVLQVRGVADGGAEEAAARRGDERGRGEPGVAAVPLVRQLREVCGRAGAAAPLRPHIQGARAAGVAARGAHQRGGRLRHAVTEGGAPADSHSGRSSDQC